MKRKVKPLQAFDGSTVPASVLAFVPADWPGDPRGGVQDGWARYGAWSAARVEWAQVNLPNGVDDLPEAQVETPDAPWDPSVI